MKHLNIILALANRQLLENRPIFALALICGLATLAFPFVIGTSTKAADQKEFLENIRAGAQVLGMVVSYGVAFYLGISLFGRELSEKRMGFFFSRPISTNALWIGKLLGAWLLIASSLLLVWLPAILIGGLSFLFQEKISWPVILFVTGALPFLFCLGLTASIAFRSRSWWLTLDLVSLMVTVLLVLFGVDRLEREGALRPLIFGGIFLSVVSMTGMLVASRISLGQGRTSLRSVHRVMSLCLWSIVFLGVGLFDGYTRWVVAITPDDFTQLRNVSPISNGWFLIGGQVRYRPDYFPPLLHNPLTGQFARVGDLYTEYSFPSVSPDGHYATWVHIPRHRKLADSGGPYSGNLVVCRLEGPIPKPQTTSLVYPSNTHFEFSPDGKSVMAIMQDRLEQISLAPLQIINQFSIPSELQKYSERSPRKAVFPSPEILRLYWRTYRNNSCQIVEVNLKTKAITQTGWLEEIGYDQQLIYCPLTDQVSYFSSSDQNEYHIVDGKSGKLRFSLQEPSPTFASKTWVFALSDGRYVQVIPKEVRIPRTQPFVFTPYWPGQVAQPSQIALLETTDSFNVQFKLFTPDGKVDTSFQLEFDSRPSTDNTSVSLCGEASSGKILCSITSFESLEKTVCQLFLINCLTGEIIRKSSFEGTLESAPDAMREILFVNNDVCLLRKYPYRNNFSGFQIFYFVVDIATGNHRQIYAFNPSRLVY